MNSVYNEGIRAFFRGTMRSENPYPVGSQESREWNAGWLDAGL
jgi:hypothetical protein